MRLLLRLVFSNPALLLEPMLNFGVAVFLLVATALLLEPAGLVGAEGRLLAHSFSGFV